MAYDAGVELLQIRARMGFATVEMTTRYIGIRAERMAAGLPRMEAYALGA